MIRQSMFSDQRDGGRRRTVYAAAPDAQGRSGGAVREPSERLRCRALVMADVNVNRHGVTDGGTVDATADDVGASACVRVAVQDLIQFNGVANGDTRDEGAYNGLAGGEISRGGI